MKIHPVFYISLLEPTSQKILLKTGTITQQNTYEVEAILEEKRNHREFFYLVK
jgi:hypothetical protein